MTTASYSLPNDCFCITSSGRLMPGRFLGHAGGFCEVLTAGGRVYTFHPDDVLSLEDGQRILAEERAAQVAASYRFSSTERGQYVEVVSPKGRGYVLSEGPLGWSCSCPSFTKSGGAGCKHLAGWQLRQGRPVVPAAKVFQSGEW